MDSRDKVLAAIVMALSAAIFFAAALSTEPSLLKAIVIIADLVFSGMVLQKLFRCEGWYGVLLLRGKNGLAMMRELGESHPKAARELTEFGFSFGFGIPYSLYAQGTKNWKKVAVHAVLLALFYLQLERAPAASSWLNTFSLPVGLLFGIAAIGFLSIFISAIGIFATKTAVSSVAPVVPGITLPFWEGLIAIIIVAIVHELAHGVLAAAEKLKVQSSGVLLLGFLPIGAFVEPDEAKFRKVAIWKKRRILVAGSTSNFLFFLVFLALTFAASAMIPSLSNGVSVSSVDSNSSAAALLSVGQHVTAVGASNVATTTDFYSDLPAGGLANMTVGGKNRSIPLYTLSVLSVTPGSPSQGLLSPGEVVSAVAGKPVYSTSDISEAIKGSSPGQSVSITVNGVDKTVRLGPDGKMGVVISQEPSFSVENEPKPGLGGLLAALAFLVSTLGITAFLNFALSVVNLLPIFVTDGHRIVAEELWAAFGGTRAAERKANRVANIVGLVILGFLLVNLGRWFKII